MNRSFDPAPVFRRITVGFLVESVAFYLIFTPLVGPAPILSAIGCAIMTVGLFGAARVLPAFRRPVYVKIFVLCLSIARPVLSLTDNGPSFSVIAVPLIAVLNFLSLYLVCSALAPASNVVAGLETRPIVFWNALATVCYLGVIFGAAGSLSVLLTFLFLLSDVVGRIRYFQFLNNAGKKKS